jgi:hypothetical protein
LLSGDKEESDEKVKKDLKPKAVKAITKEKKDN